jgi:copper homeostasis protein
VAKKTGMQVMAMVRPREGGFCYTDAEFETMLEDAQVLLENGADGIVFGFLHADGTVDKERCAKMMQVIGGKVSVFHRAIDVVPDWRAALDILIELGVTRILTSGQEATIQFGMETVRQMVEYAAGRIEVLPGGGVRLQNANAIVEKTGVTQLHIAINKSHEDRSTTGNPSIFYGGALYPPEDRFNMADSEKIGEFVRTVNG